MKTNTFKLRERPVVFGREWLPEGETRGVVALVHGLGEHSGRYAHLANALTKVGFAVTALDLRGHGKTEGKRGDWPSYETQLDDIALMLKRAKNLYESKPLFLYGHSLGGNLVINYALRRPTDKLQGVIASGPWLRLPTPPPTMKVLAAKLLALFAPSLTQPNGLQPAYLSRRPDVAKAYVEDPLVHDRISLRLFLQAHKAAQWAMEHAAELNIPMLLMHGGDDHLTSPEASREFCERAGQNCTFRLWEGMYHEIHNETDREAVYQAIIEWLEEQMPDGYPQAGLETH